MKDWSWHYEQAERLLEVVGRLFEQGYVTEAPHLIAAADVHARLAQIAVRK